jgi:hypothetical protein
LYSTANSSISNPSEGQPIPANIRKPFSVSQEIEKNGKNGNRQSPDILRVRSPQSLQRVAFDIATLRQPFQAAAKSDDKEDDARRAIENESRHVSENRSETRKTETLVA